jgi:hypothetical protein
MRVFVTLIESEVNENKISRIFGKGRTKNSNDKLFSL